MLVCIVSKLGCKDNGILSTATINDWAYLLRGARSEKQFLPEFEAPFSEPPCALNLTRVPSKKRQHEARKTQKDTVWINPRQQC